MLREQILRLLSEGFAQEIKHDDHQLLAEVSPERLQALTELLLKRFNARLSYITASDEGVKGFQVVYIFSFGHVERGVYLVAKVSAPRFNGRVPSLASTTRQAIWAERETMEFTGITFTGNPDPRHLWLPYTWPEYDYRKVRIGAEESLHAGRDLRARVIPIGPYHPATFEGQYVKLFMEGDVIVGADIKLGFNHRGVNRLIERRSFDRGVFAAERVCGICSGAHGLAYVTAVERLCDVKPPERALHIRTLLAELNRIQSHLLWLGVLCDITGFKTGFMLSWSLRERILDIISLITKHRVHYNIWRLGGVSRDIPDDLAGKIVRQFSKLKEQASSLAKKIAEHPLIKHRLMEVGTLKFHDAVNIGAVGPTARGSGWKIDVRVDHPPNAAYADHGIRWEIPVYTGQDCYARLLVRIDEILESISICQQILNKLPQLPKDLLTEVGNPTEGSEAVGFNEAPRGELLYYVKASEEGAPACVRVRTPSYRNNACLPAMLKGYTLADAPVIMASIDQCMACTDRVEVVDVKKQSSFALSWHELLAFSRKASRRFSIDA